MGRAVAAETPDDRWQMALLLTHSCNSHIPLASMPKAASAVAIKSKPQQHQLYAAVTSRQEFRQQQTAEEEEAGLTTQGRALRAPTVLRSVMPRWDR